MRPLLRPSVDTAHSSASLGRHTVLLKCSPGAMFQAGLTHPKLLTEGGTGLVRCWRVLLIPALGKQKKVEL